MSNNNIKIINSTTNFNKLDYRVKGDKIKFKKLNNFSRFFRKHNTENVIKTSLGQFNKNNIGNFKITIEDRIKNLKKKIKKLEKSRLNKIPLLKLIPENLKNKKKKELDLLENTKINISQEELQEELKQEIQKHTEIKKDFIGDFDAKATNRLVDDFVDSFLQPYIAGDITPENEKKDREPMIEQLFRKIPPSSQTERKMIEDMAFKAYIKKAVLGLYVTQQDVGFDHYIAGRKANVEERLSNFTSESKQFTILVEVLKNALPKDFPKKMLSMSEKDIKEEALRTLEEVNRLRKRSAEDAKNSVKNLTEDELEARKKRKEEIIKQVKENPEDLWRKKKGSSG